MILGLMVLLQIRISTLYVSTGTYSLYECSQKLCHILKCIKIVVFGKNSIKHPKITKYHQNLDMLGNMLLTINAETFF